MITINFKTGIQYEKPVIDIVQTIIDWQCGNCYRADKLCIVKGVIPICAILTNEGTICKRQLIKT